MVDFSGNSRFAHADMRAALVIGHPGHELLVHGWLETARPIVFVLTDGSGRSTQSRLASTSKILDQAGATCGSVYGRLTDAASYAAILNHDFDLFVALAKEISKALVLNQIDYVIGDAFEGYNPMHDVCRLVTNLAVTLAKQARGHEVESFEFSLVGQPDTCHEPACANGVRRVLDEAAFSRKLTAAEEYPELWSEVMAALERNSTDAFRVERLCPVDSDREYRLDDPPFYEQYGEKKVTAGYYDRVLRYSEHIAPLAAALKRCAESSPRDALKVLP